MHLLILRIILVLLLLVLLHSCGDAPSQYKVDPSAQLARYTLVHIQAHGKTGPLGDSARVRFTDDFWIGKHEVTQGEFRSVMGYVPSLPQALQGDSLPIVYVSMAEAIIFCNALSVRDGLDTVYEYLEAPKQNGRVSQMEGLRINLLNNGYRLPTEAEWEFVAGAGKGWDYPWGNDSSRADDYSWTANNANGNLNIVCRKKMTQGMCDLVGNSLEMTNDWLGNIPHGLLIDFTGSISPNSDDEQVVKGGSFRHTLKSATRQNRKDIYSVSIGTTLEYLGFRLARGSIISPSYATGESLINSGNSYIKVKATKDHVKDFFGTSHVRLTAVNGITNTLMTINFDAPNPIWVEKVTNQPPRHPSISPNGKLVAYGTRAEGQSGVSNLYVRPFGDADWTEIPLRMQSFASIPRWRVDPINGDTSIIFVTSSLSNADTSVWISEQTYQQVVRGAFVYGSAALLSHGAYHGGLSKNGIWLVSSFPQLIFKNIKNGQMTKEFLHPKNGKDANGSSQVCNASMSPGDTSLVAFLDFGYPNQSTLTNSSYGVHEFLFIMDFQTGVVVDTIKVPQPWNGWDFPEWSNQSGFIISAVSDEDGFRKAIYAIRMSDHAMLQLAEGSDIQMPMMWIYQSDSPLLSDSVGLYAHPSSTHTRFLSYQVTRFWQHHDSIEGVFLGSSRGLYGLDPLRMTGRFQNLSLAGGGGLYSQIAMLQYPLHQSPLLHTVVLSIDLDLWAMPKVEDFESRYGLSIGYKLDLDHQFWSQSLPTGFIDAVQFRALTVIDTNYKSEGNYRKPTREKGTIITPFVHPNWTLQPNPIDDALNALDSLIVEMRSRQIRILGVILPQQVLGTSQFGLYGPPAGQEVEYMSRIQRMQDENPDVFQVLDIHQMGHHGISPNWFVDTDHLNALGAREISDIIDSVILAWEPQ